MPCPFGRSRKALKRSTFPILGEALCEWIGECDGLVQLRATARVAPLLPMAPFCT
ncbi:hypothetical protein VTK73DRAFT_1942 [Phialemonium thermophilum]|uniref:Uncharacterized protein n=1 Tax=Phialemonium thermophilum TaxID=223376 RepID=A0ABR3VSV8_9PEZI